MPDRTGADYLIPKLGTVWALLAFTAGHACPVFSSDSYAAQLILAICQASMMLGAFFCLE
ncbi:MAG: hypothetical protein KZQ92_04740 [Candidatus Thiodiazotropha sp. (ex Lucinoma borealis)]|nr:hypothetical protein [Candidatus Thiodiazotropha sp. (ex Lucinoma borealis)]MCU7863271.1 hypothetical protein [Candidatus Thiodiazotropha sp. (ex Lucinoma borealis)]MCU7875515.1 hypothetical protein [Candidatus Thiodiazotropha sp. (ex Lucinoma borealis)]